MGEVTAPPLQSQRKHSSPAFPQGSFAFTRVHSGKSVFPAQGESLFLHIVVAMQ